MLEKLSISELESYFNLVKERQMELSRLLSIYPGDKSIHQEYDLYFQIKEKIEQEINERIINLLKTDEKTVAQD